MLLWPSSTRRRDHQGPGGRKTRWTESEYQRILGGGGWWDGHVEELSASNQREQDEPAALITWQISSPQSDSRPLHNLFAGSKAEKQARAAKHT